MFTAAFNFADFDRQFSEALTATLTAATQEALHDAARNVRSNIALQFASEGRFSGAPWLPRKARRGRPNLRPLLFSSGRLLRSLTDHDDPEHVEEIEAGRSAGVASLLIGTRVPYAAFHQRGTRYLVARPILTAAVLGGQEMPGL